MPGRAAAVVHCVVSAVALLLAQDGSGNGNDKGKGAHGMILKNMVRPGRCKKSGKAATQRAP